MTDADRGLLEQIAALQAEIAARDRRARAPVREWPFYRDDPGRWRLRQEVEHGPRVVALYGDGYHDAARKRVSRALARLEAAGLVERWGDWGRNFTHVKLTRAGLAALREAPAGRDAESV